MTESDVLHALVSRSLNGAFRLPLFLESLPLIPVMVKRLYPLCVVSSLYGFFYAINWLLLAQKKISCINIVKVDANNHISLLHVSRNLPGAAKKVAP